MLWKISQLFPKCTQVPLYNHCENLVKLQEIKSQMCRDFLIWPPMEFLTVRLVPAQPLAIHHNSIGFPCVGFCLCVFALVSHDSGKSRNG